MSQERTEQENPKTFTAKVRNVGYVPHKLHFTEEEMEYASTLDELEAARAEIDRLNANLTAKVQERDERIKELESDNHTAWAQVDSLEDEKSRVIHQNAHRGMMISERNKEIERLNTKCANLEGHNERLHELANSLSKEHEYAKRKAIEYNKLSVDQREEIKRLRSALEETTEDFYAIANSGGSHGLMLDLAGEATSRVNKVLGLEE